MTDSVRRFGSVRLLEDAFRLKKKDNGLRQATMVGRVLCLLLFCYRAEKPDDVQVECVSREYERWENIEIFLMTDPYKIVTEF